MGLTDLLKKKELDEIRELKTQLEKYKLIVDAEKEAENIKLRVKNDLMIQQFEVKKLEADYADLKITYNRAFETYNKLRNEINLYQNKLDLHDFGIYEPIFDFNKSDEYREQQKKIISLQKESILNESAAICTTNWSVEGSESKGKAITKKILKLMLRAFNGECDALIAKVKWNNVSQMKERIQKAFEAINKLGEQYTASIQKSYLDLKEKELLLEHEYNLKKQKEKEEQRIALEELREEEKARREYEQAQRVAEKEEANYQKALEKARTEVNEASGEKQKELLIKIEMLEHELQNAHERKERAISMAQQTKRGHVYIISNIGSFGDNIFKIGMTRRLEPIERVRELGDASVPFHFDIHTLIFSEDAPTLEFELHKAFADRKINMVNNKKEFFKVSIEEIEEKLKQIGLSADFIKMPEAMEYRESLVIFDKKQNNKTINQIPNDIVSDFPISI